MDIVRRQFTLDDLQLVEAASTSEISKFLPQFQAKKGFTYSTRITLREQVSPASFYLYLLGRYGPPNGILSYIGKQDPRIRSSILWHYTLSLQGELIHVIAHSYRIEVLFSFGQQVDMDPERFALLLSRSYGKCSDDISRARSQVEWVSSFLNPLSQIADSIDRMLERARFLDAELVKSRAHPVTPAEIAWHEVNHPVHSAAASEIAGCCLAARMMSPVMAEMFVNLLIYNLFRDVPSRDEEIREFSCGSILTRIRGLAKVCEGFSCEVDESAPAVVVFKDLMNRRNILLHGNVRPKERIEDQFLIHDGVPVIKAFKSIYDRSIGPVVNAYPIAEAEADYAAAREFMDYLLGCLNEGTKQEMSKMLQSLDLHHGAKDKKLRALFTNVFSDPGDLELLYVNPS
jgi:hypothetical protein